jgi:transcriptional regulator with XRE-family HTH domain
MISPPALRAMRAALDWSMRDTAQEAGVALATVLKVEQGGAVTPTTERRIRSALGAHGVTARIIDGGFRITHGHRDLQAFRQHCAPSPTFRAAPDATAPIECSSRYQPDCALRAGPAPVLCQPPGGAAILAMPMRSLG